MTSATIHAIFEIGYEAIVKQAVNGTLLLLVGHLKTFVTVHKGSFSLGYKLVNSMKYH